MDTGAHINQLAEVRLGTHISFDWSSVLVYQTSNHILLFEKYEGP